MVVFGTLVSVLVVSVLNTTFVLNTASPVARVDPAFLSVTLDGHTFDGGQAMPFWNPTSKRTLVLASALGPAFIRFGGNSHSKLIYNMTDSPLPPNPTPLPTKYVPPKPNTVMSRQQWDTINEFARQTGFRIVFALNVLLRMKDNSSNALDSSGGSWDPTIAEPLLQYTHENRKPGDNPVTWELGNEPDLFHYAYNVSNHSIFPVPPAQLLQDHHTLQQLLANISNGSPTAAGLIAGPDVANAGPSGGR